MHVHSGASLKLASRLGGRRRGLNRPSGRGTARMVPDGTAARMVPDGTAARMVPDGTAARMVPDGTAARMVLDGTAARCMYVCKYDYIGVCRLQCGRADTHACGCVGKDAV